MATFIPYLLAFKLVEYHHEYKCVQLWMRVLDDSSLMTKYFMALFIAFFLYSLCSDVYSISCDFFVTEVPERTRRTLNERSNSALKLSIAIVLGFAVSWIPFSIFTLVRLFADKINTTMSCGIKQLFEQVAPLLSRTNSAMNPCICFIFSEHYRQGLKNLLGCFQVARANKDAM